MEAIQGNLVEGAVLWLAQSILASLLLDKMEAWLRKVELADDAERLRSEVERVEAVAGALKGKAAGSRPLARSLGRLRELLYDADDLVDELDYCRLQHQVEGVIPAPAIETEDTDADGAEQGDASRPNNAGVPSSSERKKRSKAWDDFLVTEETVDGKPAKAKCVHCHTVVKCETTKGTSVLHNHLKSESCKRKRAAIEQTSNPSSVGDNAPNGGTVATHDTGSKKRMRSDGPSAHDMTSNIQPWNKFEFSSRIREMADQLQKAMIEVLKLDIESRDYH
ncbi:hypothetical protein ACP4OV_026373 [Aristida adscensionis]